MFRRVVAPDIEIRLMTEADAEPMFAVVEANRVYLRTWLPWVDQTRSPDDLRRFIREAVAHHQAGEQLHAAIWVDGAIGGAIGHHAIDQPNLSTSLGYWLAESLQGRGIVTRCCGALLDYLFDERGLHRVVIQCGTGNRASCAVPQRLGFRLEGVQREAQWVNDRWQDLKLFSLLAGEWRRQDQR